MAYAEVDEVNLTSLQIISPSSGKSIDLRPLAVQIDIYEDVQAPTLYAEIVILDALNLVQELPVIGEETLSISFKSPNAGTSTKYEMLVFALDGIGYAPNGKSAVYTLKCVSIEHITNSFTTVEKSYKTTIDNIVKDVLSSQLGTSKKINVGSTKGMIPFIIPSLSPFEAIDILRKRAIDGSSDSPFLFFENKDGFNFKSVNKLIEENSGSAKEYSYATNISVEESVKKSFIKSYRNIRKVEYLTRFDTIGKIASGGFGNEVVSYDVITKQSNTVSFKLDSDGGAFFSPNNSKFTNTSDFISKYNKPAVSYNITKDSSIGKSYLPESLGKQRAFAAHLNQNIVRCYIYGDNEMFAGGVISLQLPQVVGTTQDVGGKDIQSSGKFLISKLRHIIVQTDGKFKYNISIDCNRLGYKN